MANSTCLNLIIDKVYISLVIITTIMDSTILGPVLAAIMGSLFTWILAYGTEYHRFNNKKKGIYVILDSEFKNYISSLRRFLIYHPIKDSSKIMDTFTINDIQNFYKTLNDFPILRHDNWDEFIDTVPDIFSESEIRKIIECNSNLDKLTDLAKSLSNHEINYAQNQEDLHLNEIPYDDYRKITENYRTFEKNFSDLLDNLEEIVGIFGKKRSKFLYSFDLNLFLIILLEIIFIIGFNIALKFL